VSDYSPSPDDITQVLTPIGRVKRHVVCAALLYDDGTLILGARHFDRMMNPIIDKCKLVKEVPEEGFVDQFGNFINRKDAAIIVQINNQPLRDKRVSNLLFSENLY
jgi:hypothetical protein